MEETTRYTIGQAAEQLGVSISSLRRWEAQGIVTPERTPGNSRRYTDEQIEQLRNPHGPTAHTTAA